MSGVFFKWSNWVFEIKTSRYLRKTSHVRLHAPAEVSASPLGPGLRSLALTICLLLDFLVSQQPPYSCNCPQCSFFCGTYLFPSECFMHKAFPWFLNTVTDSVIVKKIAEKVVRIVIKNCSKRHLGLERRRWARNCRSFSAWNSLLRGDTQTRIITRSIFWLVYQTCNRRTFTSAKTAEKKAFIRTMANTARARVYSDVNVHRPREYWDYESHVIEWG